jgi:hypothetical protein
MQIRWHAALGRWWKDSTHNESAGSAGWKGVAVIKLQSAMEYLMTYGWAILIIAVVLGALFQLGVFNANNFAPKAPPGACQVFRPNGPGTTSFINLEGACSGELPQYAAQLNGASNIIVNYVVVPHTTTAFTESDGLIQLQLLSQAGAR